MTGLIIAILAAVAGWGVVRLGLAFVRLYARKHIEYVAAANDFYEAADRLANNPDTPTSVRELLSNLNDMVSSDMTAIVYARVIQKRRRGPSRQDKTGFNLRGLPQSVVPDFVIAFTRWLDAIMARSPFGGLVLKMTLDSRFAAPATAKAVHEARYPSSPNGAVAAH